MTPSTSAQINFLEADGGQVSAPLKPGVSVMETAVRNGVAGIVAECGGACSCSTCHVYLSEQDAARFAPPEEMEDALLDFVAAGRRPTSRLSCQLKLGPEHDGMTVELPQTQV